MEDLHPEKYMELHKKLLQEAKSESIRLLRDYADNHIVMSDEPEYADEDWLFARDGDDVPIQLYAYGLNEKGELCFKAWYETVTKITKTEIGVNLKNTSSPIFTAKYLPSLQSTS